MNPEGYVQSGRVCLLTLPGDHNEGLSRPKSSPTNDLKILVYSSKIGAQLSHEPQFDPAPSAQKLLISLPNERPKIGLIADKIWELSRC
jgi:hypothetical protein